MKKLFLNTAIIMASIFIVINSFAINQYCATPPFLESTLPSNVMLVLDYSGSMSWDAYVSPYVDGDRYYKWAYTNNGWTKSWYTPSNVYYGLFNSKDNYVKTEYGVWEYTTKEEDCYVYFDYYGGVDDLEGICPGNMLNWLYMTRIDILRWILTGGQVEDCVTSKCVVGYEGEEIYYKDASSYNSNVGKVEGILQEIETQKNKPRMGLSIFGYRYSGGVFKRVGLSYDYSSIINTINSTNPNGNTCTQCAMEEMEKLFSQDKNTISEYGNINPYVFDNNSVPCAKSFVLLMSDGEWNKGVNTPYNKYCYLPSCDPIDQINAMWEGGKADLDNDISNYLPGDQMVETYTVSMFANPSDNGTNALKWMAVYGNYHDLDNNGMPYNLGDNSSISLTTDGYPNTSLTQPEYLENVPNNPEVQKNANGTGPYGFYEGNDPQALKVAISSAFNEILKQVSSGTAVSVLSEKARVDMGILQAAFYPQKTFSSGDKYYTVDWIGALFNWWFYSSYSSNGYITNIREDTIQNKDLDVCSNGEVGGDYIIKYVFDNGKLKINGYKSTCEGIEASSTPSAEYNGLSSAHYIWDVGKKLAEENPFDRTIYTYTGNLQPLSEQNLQQLKDLSNTSTRIISKLFGDDNGNGIIDDPNESYIYSKEISFSDLKDYIYGEDVAGYRSRDIGDNETWKLGDIIYSTPKVVNYDNYSVAFVGANDGMLHAFLVGKYRYDNLAPYQLSKLRNSAVSNDTNKIGEELWAFIPKNVLPYLRFLSDPSYCHMYFVDLTPYVIQIKDRWGKVEKRILIGGMRLGGGVGSDNSSVSVSPPEDTCPTPSNYNPENDPSTSTPGCLGLSSYFALDITNPTQPKFLWEFTTPNLGFSYSGPAFVKEWDSTTNSWKYYVIFVSGPTDYRGDVGQHLYLFVLSLNSDFTIKSVYEKDLSSYLNLGYAFGGRLFTNGISYKELNSLITNNNLYYSTDLLFFGISQYTSSGWEGNVIGLRMINVTQNGEVEPILNPSNWHIFKLFSSPIGPVVAPISYEKCFKMNFIYFGSGRYFFKEDTPTGDVNKLYGLDIDNCVSRDCSFNPSTLYTSSNSCSGIGEVGYGWYQDLLAAGDDYNKERTITPATTTDQDVVYFTTMQPTANICGFGGRSRVWGMNCATGESLTNQNCSGYVTGNILGALLLQTSVGEISKFNVNITPSNPAASTTPFTQENGKATEWKVGTAPPSKSNYVPPPTKKPAEILYEIER